MRGQNVETKGGQTVQIFDKIEAAEPVYKYTTQCSANQHGMNLHDDANRLGEVSVTKYVGRVLNCPHNVNKPGDIVTIKPGDIARII